MMHRRSFSRFAFASALALPVSPLAVLAARRNRDKIKITGIKSHEIYAPYRKHNAETLFRYHGQHIQAKTIHLMSTNIGLVGIGENWGNAYLKPEDIKKYIGTSPFDWLGHKKDLPMNMACYDLMGKFLDIPAWKLIGPQVRKSIPVMAWTVSQLPSALKTEIREVSKMGYRWLKYHIDEIQNVVEQARVMQEVAPEGFRVQFDFNANSHIKAIDPVLEKLSKFPVIARIEDPISAAYPKDWRTITKKHKLQILGHHTPVQFLVDGLCDAYMAGHAPIGSAQHVSAVAQQVGKPFMLQQAGGTINQAFLAHEVSVFPNATIDHCNLAHLWSADVTTKQMKVTNGRVAVPDGPGLGVSIDMDRLQSPEFRRKPKYKPFLLRIRYKNGPTIYTRHNADRPGKTDAMRFLSRLLGKGKLPGPTPAYDNDVATHFISDLSTRKMQRMWQRTKNGYVVE